MITAVNSDGEACVIATVSGHAKRRDYAGRGRCPEAEANAALVVADVNAYAQPAPDAALVEALTDIMTELENNGAPTPGGRSRMAQTARAALRAAGVEA